MDDDADQVVIAQLKAGRISGLQSLVERYQAPAVQAATLITQDRAVAEEVVQEAFLRAYHRIAQFDAARPFKPWFMRLVVNAALKAAQRQQRTVSLETSADGAGQHLIDQLEATAEQPEDRAVATELREQIEKALRQLTPKQRAAVVKRYFLGLSDQELADELNCAPGTVRWYLSTARRQLRTLLFFLAK
jgi:RNA polymerase sigma-70 factor, ECF subfamily